MTGPPEPVALWDVDRVLNPDEPTSAHVPHIYDGPGPDGKHVTGTVWLNPEHGEWIAELTAALAAFWDSPAADPLDGADRYDPPLALTGQDQQPVGANPYWEIVRWLPRFPLTGEPFANPRIPALPGLLGIKRQLRRRFSYAIPSPGDIGWIAETARAHRITGITEAGAGAGYWAWQLTQAGIPVDATDRDPPPGTYAPVTATDAADAASGAAGALLLVWPPLDDPMAADAVRAFTGNLLIYCGEEADGCTADGEFFDLLGAWDQLDASPHHVTWEGADDTLTIWRRA